MPTPLVAVHPGNVQAAVANAFARPHGRYLFFTLGPPADARAFVGRLLPRVRSAQDWETKRADPAEDLVTVALTYPGLAATGALSANALSRFPRDFRNGALPEKLHDGPAAGWWNGVPAADLHALVVLHASDAAALDRLTTAVLADAAATSARHRFVRAGDEYLDGRVLATPRHVHFGYLDGFSGPSVAWNDPARDPDVDFRNFLLGYSTPQHTSEPRDRGTPADAEALTIATDGTYGAFRVMYQDVAAFNTFVADNAARLAARLGLTVPDAAEWLKEKMLGRRRGGEPLAPRADGQAFDPEANFDYAADKAGRHCPFSAHVRVVNPRDQVITDPHPSPPPRVLRRGMPYGPELAGTTDDHADRGLIGLFLCLSLTFQFQILMDWINFNDFSAEFRDSTRQDALLGNRDVPLASREFIIPAAGGDVVATGLTTFVRARGTSYLLVPSLDALRRLAA